MGLSKNGNPCIDRSAFVAAATSENTIHACPLSRYVLRATTSRTLPNWENMACRHFFNSAGAAAGQRRSRVEEGTRGRRHEGAALRAEAGPAAQRAARVQRGA